MGAAMVFRRHFPPLLAIACVLGSANGDTQASLLEDEERSDEDLSTSLSAFERACHDLIHNPTDDYLGLGEDDRRDPSPTNAPPANTPLAEVADVDIHSSGTFKYILAKISLGSYSKNVVRASAHFDLHVDNFEALRREVSDAGATATMLGGGRLTHDGAGINVYGYSATFGRCETCNSLSAEMLERQYPAE